MPPPAPQELTVCARGPLRGTVVVPGDKSISHRALMLAGLAVGESRIGGLSDGADVLATATAMVALGATIERDANGDRRVWGVGVGGLLQPANALDMGNSGTSARLLMGLLASHPLTATLIGDASLSRRPMARVIEPLSLMGADFSAAPGDRLPLTLRGLNPAVPLSYRVPVASAQVKSAILLAGLNTPGITRVIEPVATRDHSERMLRAFGAEITRDGPEISIRGEVELIPQHILIPGDPSAAAFWLVAASVVPGSDVLLPGIGINPGRIGLVTALQAMGADIAVGAPREVGGEPVADLRVRHAPLRGADIPPELAPSMIDEYPALFVAAAFAAGRTVVRGAEELRAKESDRLAAMAAALLANGIAVAEQPDGLSVQGSAGEPIAGGGRIAARHDHRVAMSMAIAGLHAAAPVTIDDVSPIATSYPAFVDDLDRLTERAA